MAMYNVRLPKQQLKSVSGEEVSIAGFEEFHFFAHHTIIGTRAVSGHWSISELTTGLAIVDYAVSLSSAVEQASVVLARLGIDAVRKRCQEITLQHGVANEYHPIAEP